MIKQPSIDTSRDLPRLKVAIFKAGRLQRLEDIADPRQALCEHFNNALGNQREGYMAFPVSANDTKRQKRPGWQVIVIDHGRASCYLKGVPVRIAKQWADQFNAEIDDRGIGGIRAFACNCAADTVIERAPCGTAAAKKRKGVAA